MEYSYVALDSEGSRVKGVIRANDAAAARRIVIAQKLDIITFKQNISQRLPRFFKSKGARLTSRELITILLNIGELDRMGMSMINIMEILKDDVATSPRMKSFCKKVHHSIKSGSTLSDAFSYHKGYVDQIFCNLVKIGEDTGGYSDIFAKIIAYIKSSDKIKRTVNLIVFKGVTSIVFITTLTVSISVIIIPKTMSFLKENGMPIPWYTQSMVSMSDFIVDRYIWFIGVLIGIVVFIKMLMFFSSFFRITIDNAKLHMPLLGSLLMNIEAARFVTFFSIMYECGTRVEIIFARVKDIVKNHHIRNKLIETEKMIMNGRLPQEALTKTMPFSSQLIKMMSIGFSAGNINEIMKNTGYFLDRDIEERVDILVSTIKPTIMILTGILVGWMAISVFGPIYNNLGNFGGDNIVQQQQPKGGEAE